MDGSEFVSSNGPFLVDGLTNNIDDSSESFGSYGDLNRIASVEYSLSSHKALSGVERNGSDVASTEMLSHLKNESVLSVLNLQGVKNGRQFSIELHVDNSADNLGYFSSQGRSRTE